LLSSTKVSKRSWSFDTNVPKYDARKEMRTWPTVYSPREVGSGISRRYAPKRTFLGGFRFEGWAVTVKGIPVDVPPTGAPTTTVLGETMSLEEAADVGLIERTRTSTYRHEEHTSVTRVDFSELFEGAIRLIAECIAVGRNEAK
jgi:hypothetical protein